MENLALLLPRSPPRRRERSRSRSRDRGGGGGGGGGYEDAAPPGAESTCGKECGEECDNNRIYVSGLPTTITESDLVDKFSSIGIIARIRQQKRGYKDQWPFSVRIYKDDSTGKPKGDCIIKYEEANSAHAALRWFDGIDFKGGKIGVAMAAKPSLNNRY
ncbi:unnamed protein product [Hapterophycus canaliculatus]